MLRKYSNNILVPIMFWFCSNMEMEIAEKVII